MKMQVLYFSKYGAAQKLAYAVSTELQCKCDSIPPAYPPENEKVIFIGMENFGSPAKNIVEFCKTLTTARVKNVAFFAASKTGNAGFESLKSTLTAKGINVIENSFECVVKHSIFGTGTPTDADLNNVKAWASDIVNSLMQ
ncbi:MAG: nitric oxide synthase [Ruminococcaceae bacterium]|nr:nitric oxide synthase [Oscillospiraceae bacterium]